MLYRICFTENVIWIVFLNQSLFSGINIGQGFFYKEPCPDIMRTSIYEVSETICSVDEVSQTVCSVDEVSETVCSVDEVHASAGLVCYACEVIVVLCESCCCIYSADDIGSLEEGSYLFNAVFVKCL